MTPLSRVLECCAKCGRELDLKRSMVVVDGVSYCGRCQWTELVGPDLRPCTPPPHFAYGPTVPSNALMAMRENDQRSGKRILAFVELCQAAEQDLPTGVFPKAMTR